MDSSESNLPLGSEWGLAWMHSYACGSACAAPAEAVSANAGAHRKRFMVLSFLFFFILRTTVQGILRDAYFGPIYIGNCKSTN